MTAGPRIGVLGGTFDPIHFGHLDTAEAVRTALALDEVLLVPSRVPPHRLSAPVASPYHRFAMVALAICGRRGFRVSDIELGAPGPSYTAATLDRLRAAGYAGDQLFFIAGADAFAEIATWQDYPALLDRCHFAVISRPAFPVGRLRERLPALVSRMVEVARHARRWPSGDATPSILLIDAPTADLSSTNIRRALGEGASISGMVPEPVESHILEHLLYRRERLAAVDLHE